MDSFEYIITQLQRQNAAEKGFWQGVIVGMIIMGIGISVGTFLYLGVA